MREDNGSGMGPRIREDSGGRGMGSRIREDNGRWKANVVRSAQNGDGLKGVTKGTRMDAV